MLDYLITKLTPSTTEHSMDGAHSLRSRRKMVSAIRSIHPQNEIRHPTLPHDTNSAPARQGTQNRSVSTKHESSPTTKHPSGFDLLTCNDEESSHRIPATTRSSYLVDYCSLGSSKERMREDGFVELLRNFLLSQTVTTTRTHNWLK
jgi:hypothetical protein